ncbi:MAG: hypothetical protein K2P58_07615 [Hyphomonadaceae bacterium]|nr:hypothetical protein [Hyphomonadaceae bacterium]
MSPSQSKATARGVVTSFVAGASAMVAVGLIVPVAVQGGLAIREAFASTMVAEAPPIAPLDVAAVQAQLAEAERAVEESRVATADEVARLDRLSGR